LSQAASPETLTIMKKKLLLTAAWLCVLATVFSQDVFNPTFNSPVDNYNGTLPSYGPQNTFKKWVRTPNTSLPNPFNTDKFKAYFYRASGNAYDTGMAFRLRYPNNYNPNNATKYPVILFMHGVGEAGPVKDNETNLSWGAKEFEAKIDAGLFNAFLLFPQTAYPDWQFNFANINATLDALQQYCNADPDRIITMGLSLGGDGTMKYTFMNPQRSAVSIAASPGSIGDFTQDPTPFIHIPFWIASGGLDDQFANPARVSAYINNFTSHGGDARWTYYPDRGHGTWPYMWDEPYLIPYWQKAHKANPLVFNLQTNFPANTAFSVKIGITPGFAQYQWQKDGADIANTTNEITVSQPGTYRVRFRRIANGVWSDWSPNPAVITQPPASDGTPPSTPVNLHVTATTTNSVSLDWDNSTDNVGVAGYDIFVNGSKQYSSTTSDVVATSLNPATSYTFTVQAHDAANNFSGISGSVIGTTATPPDVTPPSAPGNLHSTAVTTTSVSLDWDNSTDNIGVTGYDIFVNGNKTYSSTSSDYVANGLSPTTTYAFQVQAHDLANNLSGFSNTINGTTATPPDQTAPSVPVNVHVVSVTTSSITLDWDNSTDNVGVTGYDVFVNGSKQYTPTSSDVVAINLNSATTYTFTVQAHDAAGNFSGASSGVNGTTATVPPPPDVTPPSAPGNLHTVSSTTTTISLDWDNSTDNVAVTGYDVFINGTKSYSPVSSDVVATGLTAGTTYSFQVQAHDQAGNLSAFSSTANGTTATAPDITAPSIPANLHVVSSTSNTITLDWDNSTDNVAVTGYDVYRNGTKTYSTTSSDLVADNLAASTTYSFTVLARDAANNASSQGAAVTGTTTAASASGALGYKFYQGSFSVLPNFSTLTPVKTGSSANVDISVRPAGVDDNFAFVWEGYIVISTPGTYTFETVSDDGSKLYFNSLYSSGASALVNNDGLHAPTSATGNVTIPSAGTYPIAITYYEATGGQSMEVYWSGPGIARQLIPNSAFTATGTPPSPTAGLNFKYYEGAFTTLPNFSALTPVKTGTSSNVDITVRNAGVNNNFAFVWDGYITLPASGTYTFETVSDDGSKLYFNTTYSAGTSALVNNDGLHAPASATGTVTVAAGSYPITISFFQATGGVTMQVYWTGPGIARQLVPNSVFSTGGTPPATTGGLNYKYFEGSFSALPNFSALTPVKTGSSANVDITVRNAGVDNNFAFLWEGYINITTPGTYTFETVSDDGSKLYFNTTYSAVTSALVNNDGLHAANSATGTVTIPSAGTYPVAISFFQATGGESMQVYWTGPGIARQLIPDAAFTANGNPPSSSGGLNYKYYEGSFAALPNFNALTAVKTGTSGTPDITVRNAGVNDYFAFLWSGYIHITTPGTYTFETISDDGSKLYFNTTYAPGATALISNDGLHAPTSVTGTVSNLAAGYYPIAISFFEATGGETMEVYWSGPGIARQLIPASAFSLTNSLDDAAAMSQQQNGLLQAVEGAGGSFAIKQVFPNPFNESFVVSFNNPSAVNKISVDVFDVSGRMLYKQYFGNVSAGSAALRVDAGNSIRQPGIYFVRMNVNGVGSRLVKMVRK
jgi:chitodextrinase/predicted esterase